MVSFILVVTGCGGKEAVGGKGRGKDKGKSSAINLHQRSGKSMVIIGFDGVDPDLVQAAFDNGRLPNLRKLADDGVFERLSVTNPPQSPVSWTSFSTSTWPGNHGIFDFLARDPRTYFPKIGFQDLGKPGFDEKGNLVNQPEATSLRNGTTFWKVVSEGGYPVTALNIPYSFPPDQISGSRIISGLGVPDLRGTNSTCFYYATDLTEAELKKPPGGNRFIKLEGKGSKYKTVVQGPYNNAKPRKPVEIPLVFKVDEKKKMVTIDCADSKEKVAEGGWSGWFELEFDITPKYSTSGIARFHIIEAAPELKVYLSPVSMHPDDQFVPFSFPESFASYLAEEHGYFKNVGWVHDTSALNSEKLPEETFLEDSFEILQKREEMTLARLAEANTDLFISVFTITDRVSHMFYRFVDEEHPRYEPELAARFGGSIDRTYDRMDEIVGKVMEGLEEDAVLMIVSDHGFHSFRRGLNVNTWLVRNGYMALKGYSGTNPEDIPDDAFSGSDFFRKVDWNNTQAYSVGTAQIYLNIKGREGKGIVERGTDATAKLLEEIASGLERIEDPDDGAHPVQKAYIESEVYTGESMDKAPDIQLAFSEGYQTSWKTRMGGMVPELFSDNEKKWSGEHAGSDVADTEGVFFCNKKITGKPAIVDVGVTALEFFGITAPSEMEGRDLFSSN